MDSRKILIVGAGIGGLTAGYWLSQKGYDVEICEASDRPGGRMMTLKRGNDLVDVGAQFFHSNYKHSLRLIDELGLGGAKRKVPGGSLFFLDDGTEYYYSGHSPYIGPLGFAGNVKMWRLLLKYVFFGRRFSMYWIDKDIPEYDDVSALSLFEGPSNRKLREYFLEPMVMGPLDERLSLYHVVRSIRFNFSSYPIGLTGGVSSLAEELAKHLQIRYESPARQLVMEKGKVIGVQMESDGSVKKADHVIVAADTIRAVRLLPDELEEQRSFFEGVIPHMLPMPIFFLDRLVRDDAWAYATAPSQRENVMFALDHGAKLTEMTPSGKSIFSVWFGSPTNQEMFDRPDDEVTQKAAAGMERMIPGFSQWIEHVEVVRHPIVVAGYDLGAHRRALDFLEKAKQLEGVSFVSDVFGACYMEGAMESAAAVVQQICESDDASGAGG
jgi:oxygen-dependent protoporphyrinogen oxidase